MQFFQLKHAAYPPILYPKAVLNIYSFCWDIRILRSWLIQIYFRNSFRVSTRGLRDMFFLNKTAGKKFYIFILTFSVMRISYCCVKKFQQIPSWNDIVFLRNRSTWVWGFYADFSSKEFFRKTALKKDNPEKPFSPEKIVFGVKIFGCIFSEKFLQIWNEHKILDFWHLS